MAASLCRFQLHVGGKSRRSNSGIPSSGGESAGQIVAFAKESNALGKENQDKRNDDFSDRSVRWTTKATAAAATLTLITAAPTVFAAEVDFTSSTPAHAGVPGDHSLSIAIPIPDQGTWMFDQNGFLAPPPSASVRDFGVARNPVTGGCPSWHPINFEMVVPDGVRPKTFPRQGAQWSALYIIEDESKTIYTEVIETSDPDVRYSSILDSLLRMSDLTLTCFRL